MTADEFRNLELGLYRVYWKSGGSSLAAVGQTENGERWLAPTNWVAPSVRGEAWEDVDRVVLITSQHALRDDPRQCPSIDASLGRRCVLVRGHHGNHNDANCTTWGRQENEPTWCRGCGGAVPIVRESYRVPTCYACLPPQDPLPTADSEGGDILDLTFWRSCAMGELRRVKVGRWHELQWTKGSPDNLRIVELDEFEDATIVIQRADAPEFLAGVMEWAANVASEAVPDSTSWIGWRDRRPTPVEVAAHAKSHRGDWLVWTGSPGTLIEVAVLDAAVDRSDVPCSRVNGSTRSLQFWNGELYSDSEKVQLRWRPVTREMFAAQWPVLDDAPMERESGIVDPDVAKELRR